MSRPYRTIVVERKDDIFCARLKRPQLDEGEVSELGEELAGLVNEEGCRKLVVSIGPEPPQLIYSVFVGKLVMVRRLLQEKGGALKLCEVSPHVRGMFDALQLSQYFEFYADQAAALASFGESAARSND
jgi:anti-sigma B factor antagonist